MRSTPYMSSFVSATTLHIVARTRLERSSGGFFFFVNVSERRSSAADLVGRSGKIVWLGGGNRQKRPDADAKHARRPTEDVAESATIPVIQVYGTAEWPRNRPVSKPIYGTTMVARTLVIVGKRVQVRVASVHR